VHVGVIQKCRDMTIPPDPAPAETPVAGSLGAGISVILFMINATPRASIRT